MKEDPMLVKTIGIDLGTTNSVVSVIEGKDPVVISNEEGGRTTPSVVAWNDQEEILVGQIAKRQAVTNPEGTVSSIKRFIGRRFSEVAEEISMVSFKVVEAKNGDAQIEVRGKRLSPPEISAKVLMKLKKSAEEHLGQPVTDAVITVPAYFNDAQRQATKDAGHIAGLNVKRIVNEPTAAAMAYGLDKSKQETIAVFDFGGGTFDISILELGDKVVEVLATNGDTHLGGDNIDQKIIEWLISEFKKDQGIDVSKDKMVIQRLKEEAEKAKIELSSMLETQVHLPFLTADAAGPKHMNSKLTRAKFESLIIDLAERTLEPCRKALKDAGKKPGDIDEVVLVGGSTRIPLVQQKVKELFDKEPHKGVNPDEVVAMGAAMQAGVLSGEVKDILLLDVTPLSLGVETQGNVMTVMISRNTTIPAKKTEIYSTAADNQTSVEIHVLQGERPMAQNNRTLGRFSLDGILPALRGVPKIEVTFDIDANGIVNVSAKDTATGKEQRITITASSGLSESEIDLLFKEAEQHKDEDEKRRKEIETKNRAEGLVYSTERTLDENREKLPVSEASETDSALADLKSALETNEVTSIERSMENLTKASHKLAEVMYGQPSGANSAAGEPTPSPGEGNEDVIEAEFEQS
jgi:molecular chaperone DnaK